jgi:N-acetylneuraminic acid mutarotase
MNNRPLTIRGRKYFSFYWTLFRAILLFSLTMNITRPMNLMAAPEWTGTASLITARHFHTTTLLTDGRILVVGGFNGTYLASVEIYHPATNTCIPKAQMNTARANHTTTMLADGRILVVGGFNGDYLGSAEIYNPSTNSWNPISSMMIPRSLHTSTLLTDGRILVAGGSDGTSLDSTEIFDPGTNSWTSGDGMSKARDRHTAVLLSDGQVLVAGGYNDNALPNTEIYNPVTNSWTSRSSMKTGRYFHTATLLPNGKVLVAGGSNGVSLYSTEIFDPTANTWTPKSNLNKARERHSAALLPNGRVLVAGGSNGSSLDSVEIYDPASNIWASGDSKNIARYGHTATLLADGRVLVAGGRDVNGPLNSTEIYDPITNTWVVGPNMTAFGSRLATLLLDGRVLVIGGIDNTNYPPIDAEVFDPNTNTWSIAASMNMSSDGGSTRLTDGRVLVIDYEVVEIYDPVVNNWTIVASLNTPRYSATVARLADGRVLVVGGLIYLPPKSVITDSVEIYDSAGNTWTYVTSLNTPRYGHEAILLSDGRVLVTGGYDIDDRPLFTTEIYDPVTNTWTYAAPMKTVRGNHTATALLNGRVLVISGEAMEIYDPATNTWNYTDNMRTYRYYSVATLLSDGHVLVTGGIDYSNTPRALASPEIYAPTTDSWTNVQSPAGNMSTARSSHSATLLPDGRLFVIGGIEPSGSSTSVEFYNLNMDIWASKGNLLPNMNTAREKHTATLLPDGRVLVVGGQNNNDGPLASTEIFDPLQNTWTYAAAMNKTRYDHTATLMPNGRVLVSGGNPEAYSDGESYDPLTNTWSSLLRPCTYTTPSATLLANGYLMCNFASPPYIHHQTTTLLLDGTLLVVGWKGTDGSPLVEIYDPKTFTSTPAANIQKPRMNHTATLLPDGRVLVAGGSQGDSVEIYDPRTNTWTYAASMNYGRNGHTTTLLPDGRVLVVGGYVSSEIYDPATNTWTILSQMNTNIRIDHAATLLLDGRVLVVGGRGAREGAWDVILTSYEIFDFGLGFQSQWRPTIENANSPTTFGSPLILHGSGFRGHGHTEASGGSSNTSPTNYPLVQLRRLDNEQIIWLKPGGPYSPTTFISSPLNDFIPGPSLVTVYVNGIPSISKYIQIQCETAIALSSSQTTSSYGTLVTITAVVTSSAGTPYGTVQFRIDGVDYDNPVPPEL